MIVYGVEVQLRLFVKHFLFFPPGTADSQLALPDCEELNGVEQFCKNCETQLHSFEPDVIQDMLSSLHRSKLLTTCNPAFRFAFSRLHSSGLLRTYVKPSSHGGFYIIQVDGEAVPLHPLGHSQLKMWKMELNK